ncbi:MAG: FxLYD domain-containing protein [bacterium]|nr:FxLYD domain-containing protein [bacterium]
MKKFLKFVKSKSLFVTLIIVALFMIVAGGFLLFREDSGDLKYEDYTVYKGLEGSIEEYDSSMVVDGYKASNNAYYITGKISSKADKGFSIITFNLYNKKNELMGTAVAGLNELKKDKIYDFKAIALVDGKDLKKIDSYKLKSVVLG